MWLLKDDRNSKYFYRKSSNRQQKNQIMKLLDDNGVWVKGDKLNSLIIGYFKSIFSTSNLWANMDFLAPLLGRVLQTMNVKSTRDFTKEEIFSTIIQMHPTKAPEPSACRCYFFRSFGISLVILSQRQQQSKCSDLANFPQASITLLLL